MAVKHKHVQDQLISTKPKTDSMPTNVVTGNKVDLNSSFNSSTSRLFSSGLNGRLDEFVSEVTFILDQCGK